MSIAVPRRRPGPELLDLPEEQHDPAEFARGLYEIRLSNRYLGGLSAVTGQIPGLLERALNTGAGVVRILDIATGTADVPAAIIALAGKAGPGVRVVGIDLNPNVIKNAVEENRAHPEMSFIVADGLRLPFRDESFDIAVCSLTLHHMTDGQAVALLKEARRVSSAGYVIADLRRSGISFTLFWVLTRLLSRNRFTRHDGPLSILRAFTPAELKGLAVEAGLEDFRVVKLPFWRMALVGRS